MLNLILIDVQYSQKVGFNFEKDHISSGFLHLVKKSSPLKFPIPLPRPTLYCYLENPGDGV